MTLQKETAWPVTATPLKNTETDSNDTPQSRHVNGAVSPEIYHVFETKSSARAFRALIGKDHNIVKSGIGWQVEPVLPASGTVYLWPERLDPTGFKWIDDCAATAKATLKLATSPANGGCATLRVHLGQRSEG